MKATKTTITTTYNDVVARSFTYDGKSPKPRYVQRWYRIGVNWVPMGHIVDTKNGRSAASGILLDHWFVKVTGTEYLDELRKQHGDMVRASVDLYIQRDFTLRRAIEVALKHLPVEYSEERRLLTDLLASGATPEYKDRYTNLLDEIEMFMYG